MTLYIYQRFYVCIFIHMRSYEFLSHILKVKQQIVELLQCLLNSVSVQLSHLVLFILRHFLHICCSLSNCAHSFRCYSRISIEKLSSEWSNHLGCIFRTEMNLKLSFCIWLEEIDIRTYKNGWIDSWKCVLYSLVLLCFKHCSFTCTVSFFLSMKRFNRIWYYNSSFILFFSLSVF